MKNRRAFILAGGAVLAFALVPGARAQRAFPVVTVYKNPSCGCCGAWVAHMQANGFRVETREVVDVSPIRRQYGVPDALASCHTAVVAGYAIEGHVPAADVKRLLLEKGRVKGLSVPGMVAGSPGMEQGPPRPYATIAFDARGSSIYARH